MNPNLHLTERDERRGRRLPALALLAVIALLSSAMTGLFGFLEINAAYGTAEDLEAAYICDPDEFDLTFPNLSRLSEVYTADGALLGQLTERNSQPVSINRVPEVVRNAVLAAEDADFYEHEGLDFKGILRAALENVRSDAGLQGGSTITQQVVKRVFLSNEVTLERKICEGVVAAELERRYTKDQILEFYVNSVFYGANAYGIKAAAQEYFHKPLGALTIAEAATIVVPIRNPSFYSIRTEPERVLRARNDVIDNMAAEGFITMEEAIEAKRTPLEPAPHRDLLATNPEILIAAKEEVLNDSRYNLGDSYAERKQALFGCPANDTECTGGGGLRITITVNKAWNDEATRMLRTWFQEEGGPTGAIAMLDNDTGALRVMASGLEFGTDIEAGQRPYDIVTKGRRQAGSAFKPITLVAAMEQGSQEGWDITLGTFWDAASPQELDCGFICSEEGDIWTVRNAGEGGTGVMSLEEATYNSTNTVFAQVSLAVGPAASVEMAHRLGIESPLNAVPSIALGAEAVSPFEMAAAYSTIANYGERVEPYLIERIETLGGRVVYQHEVTSEQVIDPSLGAAVVSTLEKVVCCGTATRADIDRPQAGKTGTAQNFRDVWYVGFIPQFTTAVWSGYPDAQVEMVDFSVYDEAAGSSQYYSRAFGGTLTAPIWAHFMRYVTADLPVEDFPEAPAGTSEWFRIPTTIVPDVSGLSEEEARSVIAKAGLRPSLVEAASTAPEGTFLGQSPGAGAEVEQGTTVTVSYSSGFVPVVPNLLGLTADEVAGAVSSYNSSTGLNLSFVIAGTPVLNPVNVGIVVRTDPPPGASISSGGTITVYVGEPGPAPPPEPPPEEPPPEEPPPRGGDGGG